MLLNLEDIIRLLHPILAVTCMFPILGLVASRAWETRRRRLAGSGSKIPGTVGREHLQLGKLFTAVVVGITLLGLTRPIFSEIISKQVWQKDQFQVIFVVLIYIATLASLAFLYRARQALWRAVFATLTGMGVVVLGFQNGVYRRDEEWYVSHFYFGIAVALLMIFSLAIVEEIYKDRSQTWRRVHIFLNAIALIFFLAQGVTGTRDLLEIPLSWQTDHIYRCNYDSKSPEFKSCPPPAPQTPG
jgi:hypothetical protein